VAAFRRAARERGGPLPSIDVADALLDERRELAELGNRLAACATEWLIGPPLLSLGAAGSIVQDRPPPVIRLGGGPTACRWRVRCWLVPYLSVLACP
jgi:hypothetical protein